MKKKIVILVFLLFGTVAFGQENNKQQNLLDLTKKYTLAEDYYSNGETQKSLNLINNIEEELLKKNTSDSLPIIFYNFKGLIYSRQKKFKKSDSLFRLSIKYSKKNNYKPIFHNLTNINDIAKNKIDQGNFKGCINNLKTIRDEIDNLDLKIKTNLNLKADFYNNYAISEARLGNLNEASVLFEENKQIRKVQLDTLNIKTIRRFIRANNNYALCSSLLNKKEEALTIYLNSLVYAEKYNLKAQQLLLYKNLANDYLILMKYEEAEKYSDKVIEISKKNNDLYYAYNTLGLIYLNKKEYTESERYLRLSYKNAVDSQNKYSIANSASNIAIVLMENNKIEEAPFFLKICSDYFYGSRNKSKINNIDELYGRYYLASGSVKKAKTYFLKVESNITNIRPIEDFHITNKMNLYNSHIKTNNYKSASKWLKEAFDLQLKYDSVKKIENVNELTIKYQTQQKENQILKLENEAQQKEISLQKSKTKTNLAIVSIFLVVVGGVLFNRKRKKDQKLQLLETSVKGSEDEKKRIGKELHDGIAGGLMNLVHETETKDVILSHKLLNSYNQIRDLSHQLNNTSIHGELFMDRLFEIVPENNENQLFEVSIVPQYLELEEPYSTHIYRIILELFTNNLKYANASKTKVSLSLENNVLTLLYSDNGKGVTSLKKGNGLKSIDNRVTLLNGKLKIDIEKGFHISIEIPHKS
jgi:signal transduction histidine kinase